MGASYHVRVVPPSGPDWLALTDAPLPVATVHEWLVEPASGGQVVFTGTVRDHAEGRPGVTGLEYEAYTEMVVPKLARITELARERWPDLGRLALLHRTGELALGEVSVVVGAAAPHRAEAFEAARHGIERIKQDVPIWKKEGLVSGDAHWVMGS